MIAPFRAAAGTAALCLLVPAHVWSQPAKKPRPPGEPKWTLAIHAGGALGPMPSSGSAGQFPTGGVFTTEGGFQSRTNPSWYFGDGAKLFNEVSAQFASQFNQRFGQIAPLDGMLTAAAVERTPGVGFGVRLGRQITRRFGVEFGFDRSQGDLQLTGSATQAIEAARASFQTSFTGLLATTPLTGLALTSTADVPDAVSFSQTLVSGVLNISLTSSGRLSTHASVGAGGIFNSADPFNVRVRGNYQFRVFDTFPINETDLVVIHFTEPDRSIVGLAGAGLTYHFGRRHGLRFDAHLHFGKNGHEVSLDATPSVPPATPAVALPSRTSPSLQFSTLSSSPSSLNGTRTLTTFTGSGLETRILVTVGYVVRF